ncbi:MarR family winged helix-turn-helix transcriptional regulator [Nannocystis punicea]|uniref:MarR family transcriptional regulator n=1 Tax=Nannocystis punicea TaxID=2995304 RepID=A0ABY7H826_9BACT|nr:MarR family transcriptional regulator [Nannocystis poenicansa]WAS95240.1 MarR family transcriptional regulator [Nannocystis poenicansa]
MAAKNLAMELASRALSLFPRFNRWASSAVRTGGLEGLSLRQFAVLAALRRDIHSPSDIAARLMVTPAVVTGLLARLERQGYVRREVAADDRRRHSLHLTDAGLKICHAVQQRLARELGAQFAGATAAELAELGRAFDRMDGVLAELEQALAAKPAGKSPRPRKSGAASAKPRTRGPAAARKPPRRAS